MAQGCARQPNPIWWFFDHTGLILNDEYYAHFLTNTFPYLPQNVYQDPDCTIPWANPLQFQASGNLPDNLYFDDDLVYRIEIRHGPTQSDALIWEINNYQPTSGGGNGGSTQIESADNLLSNPQFYFVNFTNDFEIDTAGSYEIAPGWVLRLVGAGTSTVTKLVLTGVDAVPYAIQIETNGWAEAYLEQTFDDLASLFDTGAVSASLVGRANVAPKLITMNLLSLPSPPGTPQEIASGTLGIGNFETIEGTINLAAPTNNTSSDEASMVFQIVLPGTGEVELSNIQFVGQSTPLDDPTVISVPYHEQPLERQEDHLFHYYRDSIVEQTKDNLLTGWTFGLNPWQFITPGQTLVAAQTQYVADQTILHQETAGAYTSGQIGSVNGGIQFAAVNGVPVNRFAMIQYIDKETIRPYWGQNLSVLARAALFTQHGTVTKLKARLIYRANAPPTIGAAEPITGWDADGNVTFAAGWTAIEPKNDPAYEIDPFTLAPFHNLTGYSFDQFQLPSAPSAASYVGLVLYITDPIDDTIGLVDAVIFDRVSLVPNDFAIDASTETWDETLRKCQYYYEKSYETGLLPGSITISGSLIVRTSLAPSFPAQFHPFSFGAPYAYKNRIPTLTLYSPVTGVSGAVSAELLRNGSAAPVAGGSNPNPSDLPMAGNYSIAVSQNGFVATCVITLVNYIEAAIATSGDEGALVYQFTVDARLGV